MTTSVQNSEIESLLAEFAPAYEYYADLRTEDGGRTYNDEPYGGDQSQSAKIDHVVDKMPGDPVVRMVVDQKVTDPAVKKELKLARGYLQDLGTIQTGRVRKAALDRGDMKLLLDTETWTEAYARTPLMKYELLGTNSVTFHCKAVELSTEVLAAIAGFAVGPGTAAAQAFQGFIQELGKKIRLKEEKVSSPSSLIVPNSRAVYNEQEDEVEAWHNVNTIDAQYTRRLIESNCASAEMIDITISTRQINGTFNMGALTRYPKVKSQFEDWIVAHLSDQLKEQEVGFGFDDVEKKR